MATQSSPDKKKKHPKKPSPPKPPVTPPTPSGQPIFGQPTPSPDPTGFKNPVTDQNFSGINVPSAVPMPLIAAVEPVLTLAQVYGQPEQPRKPPSRRQASSSSTLLGTQAT